MDILKYMYLLAFIKNISKEYQCLHCQAKKDRFDGKDSMKGWSKKNTEQIDNA